MLDDDIIMPCADVERGFAQWRHHPERVTGFYPRILEGDPPQYQCIKVSLMNCALASYPSDYVLSSLPLLGRVKLPACLPAAYLMTGM